ncbi:MAG: hypothetical protein ABR590_03890 [Spirochaetia bacterium]
MSCYRAPVRRTVILALCIVKVLLTPDPLLADSPDALNRVAGSDMPAEVTNVYVHVAAERLRRASLAEGERILRDPVLQAGVFIAPVIVAALQRPRPEEREFLLIRALDALVLYQNGAPRTALLAPNEQVFRRLAERYYSFSDPSLRYRVLLLTAEYDAHAASKMVQHGLARVLVRLNEGGAQLSAAEVQEALVMCRIAVRFPHPAAAVGAALVAEKARIPELVHAARDAARSIRASRDEGSE